MNALGMVTTRRRCGHGVACYGASWSSAVDTTPKQNDKLRRVVLRRRRCHRLPTIIAHRNFHASTRHHQQQEQQEQLRIAIVGGGPAGMTAALHLSPLVSAGLIVGPVDVYEQFYDLDNDKNKMKGGGRQDYPGAGALGRNVGVGLWSTAWWPFLHSIQDGMTQKNDNDVVDHEVKSKTADNAISAAVRKEKDRISYRKLLHDLEHSGSYVGEVGYRTPNGSWLVESELNSSPFGIDDLLQQQQQTSSQLSRPHQTTYDDNDPALLFLRERDLLSCLHTAINVEQELGTIKYHPGIKVEGIANVDGDSGLLILQRCGEKENADNNDGVTSSSEERYNLIISADGLYSPLRSRFAGYASSTNPHRTVNEWEHMHRISDEGHRLATMVEERGYVVFRGNAPGFVGTGADNAVGDRLRSFQTWGENRAMRFAAVPFTTSDDGMKKEVVVWFATISSDIIIPNDGKEQLDATQQKALLLEALHRHTICPTIKHPSSVQWITYNLWP